jgi:superfamily II DNA or RNA helicase
VSAPTLRPYQLSAIAKIDEAFAHGHKSPLVVAPTGSGKTVIGGDLIRREADAGKRVLFLAPRRELIEQASRKLDDVGVPHGIILAGDNRQNLYAPVQVASIDTVRARQHKLVMLDPHLVVADEAHLYVTEIRQKLLARWDVPRIGLTATPCRKDGRGLRQIFDTMIQVATVAELTAQGHLVPARYFSIAEPDLAKVSTVGGDYHQGELAAEMLQLVADVPRTWLERAGGRRTAVFAVNVAHSVALCAEFVALGVRAEHVDGSTPTIEREAIFRRFSTGETQVLCNCQIASIGFDLPALDCIQLARPTKSLALYLQMLGRGLRPAPGKADCLVLDHSGAVHRHGFAHDERFWTLDGHADMAVTRATREKTEGKEITCPECTHVYTGSRTCPECGHYIKPKGKMIETLDGDLVEIGTHLKPEEQDRMAFYLEARGYAAEHGFKPGFAAHKFREKFGGDFPPWRWNDLPPAMPTRATRGWMQSRRIAYAKATSTSTACT